MPPAVFSSASSRLTTILSLRGTTFIRWILLGKKGRTSLLSGFPGTSVSVHQGPDDGVEQYMLADRLGDDAIGMSTQCLPHQVFRKVGSDDDTRQQRVDLPHHGQRFQAAQSRHLHVEQ